MSINVETFQKIKSKVYGKNVQLVAVSKTKPLSDIQALYKMGHRHFGENKVQELLVKHEALPKDINWHFLGHLQTNKVKRIVPFVYMIHAVDSLKLAREIDKQAKKNNTKIRILLQQHIAKENSKYGFSESELLDLLKSKLLHKLENIDICGMMGMATNSTDKIIVANEFRKINALFAEIRDTYFSNSTMFNELSIGMSQDYELALNHGSTMVRIGSLIFGKRNIL